MGHDVSRRDFLKFIGATAGAIAISPLAGCLSGRHDEPRPVAPDEPKITNLNDIIGRPKGYTNRLISVEGYTKFVEDIREGDTVIRLQEFRTDIRADSPSIYMAEAEPGNPIDRRTRIRVTGTVNRNPEDDRIKGDYYFLTFGRSVQRMS